MKILLLSASSSSALKMMKTTNTIAMNEKKRRSIATTTTTTNNNNNNNNNRLSSSSSSAIAGLGIKKKTSRTSTTTTTRRRSRRTVVQRVSSSITDVIASVGDLEDVTNLLANGAFASLFVSSSIYCTKAVFFPTSSSSASKQQQRGSSSLSQSSIEQNVLKLANVFLALTLSARWYESGHFPLSNMYESLLFLAWGTTATVLMTNQKDSKVFGALVAPVALFTVAGATLGLPKELQRASALVPALKSNWLMMHVSVMMMSYATLLAGSLACMGYLLLEYGKNNEKVGELTEKMERAMFSSSSSSSSSSSDSMTKTAEIIEQEDRQIILDNNNNGRQRSNRPKIDAKTGEQITAFATTSSIPSSSSMSSSNSNINSSNSVGAVLEIQNVINVGDRSRTELDNLSYRCLGLGFVLLTAGLISGAVWANEAWGSYWSWDPKETWALVTWFTYATYLHSRLVKDAPKAESARIGAFGFIVVWICYVGVNLFGTGLHSYGWFANR